MWVPAIVSLLLRLIRREGFRSIGLGLGVGFRRPSTDRVHTKRARTLLKPILLAILFPLAVASLTYGGAWLSGLVRFQSIHSNTASASILPALTGLLSNIFFAATAGTLIGIVMVAGEEIGWRGYMSEKLCRSGIKAPHILGGLIWSAWHSPLILSGQYAAGPSPVLSLVCFTILALSLHHLWSWWRLETGSLWPAIIAHSAWNSIIQHPFDGHTAGQAAPLWLGDSGVLVVTAAALGVLLIGRRRPARKQLVG
ncbi:MAG: CPBP family intramembrane glutamic endopeptidase [Spirochaetota bacterium]